MTLGLPGLASPLSKAPTSPTAADPANSATDVPAAATDVTATSGIWSVFSNNPYFHAGAGLYVLTVGGVAARAVSKAITVALKRRYVVSLETTSRDPTYNWLMQWLSNHPTFHFQQMSVISSKVVIHANEETGSESLYAPCPGQPHYMMHNGWPIIVNRKRQMERAMGNEVMETLEFTTLGRSQKIMQDIVDEAKKLAVMKDSDRTVIYHNAGPRWVRHAESRARRPLQSVVLDGSMREDLVIDVSRFLGSQEYYTSLGVPYRRGYLLHGPPGCGKSSLVVAIAGELRLAICVLSLSNRSLDDDSLNSLLNEAPVRSIVLLEDIDRAFTADSRVTMSGLLNALDGVAAQEGRIVFMTTNHVERLDAALIRPGRADVKLEIGLMSQSQLKELFAKFFPSSSSEQKEQFASQIPGYRVSPAQLQAHLFANRSSAVDAIAGIPAFLQSIDQFETRLKQKKELDERIRSIKPPPML